MKFFRKLFSVVLFLLAGLVFYAVAYAADSVTGAGIDWTSIIGQAVSALLAVLLPVLVGAVIALIAKGIGSISDSRLRSFVWMAVLKGNQYVKTGLVEKNKVYTFVFNLVKKAYPKASDENINTIIEGMVGQMNLDKLAPKAEAPATPAA